MISDLTLPYPPSANRYWRTRRGGLPYLSEAAKDYKAIVADMLRGAAPSAAKVEVVIKIHRPAARGDLDNCLKILLDALKGLVFVDDDQVRHIDAWLGDEDKARPRAELMFRELGPMPARPRRAVSRKPRLAKLSNFSKSVTPNYVSPQGRSDDRRKSPVRAGLAEVHAVRTDRAVGQSVPNTRRKPDAGDVRRWLRSP